MADRHHDDIRELRQEIGQTRADLNETISSIRHKLDPERLKHQAQDAARDATIGRAEDAMSRVMDRAEDAAKDVQESATEAGSSIVDTIRQNPIPAAMVGLGLSWLFANRPGKEQPRPRYREREYEEAHEGEKVGEKRVGQTREAAREMLKQVRGKAGETMGGAREAVGRPGPSFIDAIRENPIPAATTALGLGWLLVNMGAGPERRYPPSMEETRGAVGETVGRARAATGDIAGRAQETVGEVSEEIQERVGSVSRETRERYSRLEDRIEQSIDTNPLAVGAISLAIGAGLAMMLPGTPQERRVLGEARETLMEKAQGAAQQTMEKVQHVAEEAQGTAKKEAREQGLAK